MLISLETAVLDRIDDLADEMVEFLKQIVRIPTVNPPGENYAECARVIGDKLKDFGYDVNYVEATGRPECTRQHPRVNLIARLAGENFHPTLHFNGHIDVVPPGQGWTTDPFAGIERDGRIYGRGVT
ncbi:MAG TPA: M20/M25/M40 family metallo-hydrolase, partial [Blastocatellia bacterium]|nr:M20/M25/M40 family metallo-hydrolase [Blastocatellia bacterium]